jgi:hypothetical protein
MIQRHTRLGLLLRMEREGASWSIGNFHIEQKEVTSNDYPRAISVSWYHMDST